MTTSSIERTLTSSFVHKELYDICELNGAKFVLFSKKITCGDSIDLELSGYNVVILAPMEAEQDISIKAVNFIALSHLNAKNGELDIQASGKVIALGANLTSKKENKVVAHDHVYTPAIYNGRLEMILDEFKEGISSEDGREIINALMDTYDAIVDPADENSTIDRDQGFEFFQVPIVEESGQSEPLE